jgi:hypothetical protein
MWFSLLCFAGAASACSATWTPIKEDPGADTRHAAHELAAARCDRQIAGCELETNTHYDGHETCIEAKLMKSVTEARLVYCDFYPLSEARLRTCVQEIRQGQCGEGITKIDNCRGAKLCPYETEEATVFNDTGRRSRSISRAVTRPTL